MSEDGGIYILQTLDGWRVVYAQGIDNLYWWPVSCCDEVNIIEDGTTEYDEYYCTNCGTIENLERRDELNPQAIADYFGHSNVLKSEYEAMEEATIIYKEVMEDDFCPIIEYGISRIHGLEDTMFPVHLTCQHENTDFVDGQEQCDDCGEWV